MLTLLSVSPSQSQEPDVCLWHRSAQNGLNNMLNSLYVHSGTHDGRKYYVSNSEDCQLPVLYLYYHSPYDAWLISHRLGIGSFYARCTVTKAESVSECGRGQWRFAQEASNDESAEVFLTNSGCPTLNEGCAAMELSYSDGSNTDGCSGVYDARVSEDNMNAWQSTGSGRFLYFNEKAFTWVCAPETKQSSCYSLYSNSEDKVWQELNVGESVTLSWSNGKNAKLKCLAESSGSSGSSSGDASVL